MFRPLRRVKKQLSTEQAVYQLSIAKEGILSTLSVDNGYPYAVAVNPVLLDDCIYFHSALEGHKIDNIKQNPKVSFFVITKADIIEETYTTDFTSVHVFGHAEIVEDDTEKYKALAALADKFTGPFSKNKDQEIKPAFHQTMVVKIHIDHIEGKSSNR